jgi:DNA-binding MarR family transcriptional regulator
MTTWASAAIGPARGLLSARPMNAIFFGCKRVFHGAVRISRAPLHSVAPGLTAARFDMMCALVRQRFSTEAFQGGWALQSDLRKALGVSAPVVSRMLRSLEALGWVTRRRSERDGRQRDVGLTESGFTCIRSAYKLLVRIAQRIVYRAICWGKHRDVDERFFNMGTLESYLNSLRSYCRDTATIYYAWGHPDD